MQAFTVSSPEPESHEAADGRGYGVSDNGKQRDEGGHGRIEAEVILSQGLEYDAGCIKPYQKQKQHPEGKQQSVAGDPAAVLRDIFMPVSHAVNGIWPMP